MIQERLWLIFDIGTSGAKAALITDTGNLLRTATHPYETYSAAGGINEQNASDWWNAFVTVCRSFAHDLSRVSAIAITGQMQDMILLGADGTPTYSVILYNDTRASAEADEIVSRIGAEHLIVLTGNEQGADSLWAKLLWLSRHQPDALSRSRYLLFNAADAVIYHLTGNAITDTTTASTTGLFNLVERRWLSQAMLDDIGIGMCARLLPQLVTGGAQVGSLLARTADQLGLPAGLPVYHAPGDAGAATIGAGSGEIGRGYGYLGTSGWVAFTSDVPGSPLQGVFTLAHPRTDRFIQIAPLLTAAGNVEWIRDLFTADSLDNLIEVALARPSSNLLYLPYLNGERTPFRDPLARAAFIGLASSTDQIEMVRAVLEGVAFGYRHACDALMPQPPDRLILTGGGTRSTAWCQLFADVLGIDILIGRDAEHVGIRGALLAAQVGSGERVRFASDPPIERTLHPDPSRYANYHVKYQVYRAAYPAMKSLFSALGSQMGSL